MRYHYQRLISWARREKQGDRTQPRQAETAVAQQRLAGGAAAAGMLRARLAPRPDPKQ